MAELSGFEVLALLKEIDSALRGTYINNIYSFGTSQLLRLRKPEAPDVWLVVSPRKGAWISASVTERADTTEFTSKLRGELERGRFAGTGQVDLDRVFEIVFDDGEQKKLILELMPPGNIVVVGGNGRVVLARQEFRSPARRVVRGEPYQPPRQTRISPLELRASDVALMREQERTAGRAIGRHVALPKKYVAESLSRLGLNGEDPASRLTGRESDLVRVLQDMVREARDNPRPCICRTEDGEDIFVVPPAGAEIAGSAKTLSELCDSLFLRDAGEVEEVQSAEAGRKKELEVTIDRLRAEALSLTDRAAKARSTAAVAASSKPADALRLLKDAGRLPAREPSSPAAVASALFDEAKELERRAADALEAAGKLEKRADRIKPGEGPRTKSLSRKTREWYEKFRWFVSSGGRLAVGGRDAQSNTILVKRHLEDGDVVYHADLFGSPFFVLKDGRGQTEEEVLEIAQATVSFSSGWKTGLGAADAYWVNKDQISSTTESGEYLARGSFVIRGKKNFVRHALIQVAVGLDVGGRVMAGPESAIAKACSRYIVLAPHREKASDTAKKVLRELSEGRSGEAAPSLDDVVRALPAGGGKIVRRK
ncbi:MAG TPA: NFACT family protein [Nitrososphaerales archaeon]|nr:NFACT family protein [Nitrososphaerales archaeon]